MASKIHTLKQVPIFSSLEEKQVRDIADISIEKFFLKNEVIFHEGDPGSSLFIVKSGVIKISLIDPNGKEAILQMLYETDFFGEMSLLDGQFRSATVSAVEDSKALMISQKDFTEFIQQHPDVIFSIVAGLNRRLRKANDKIASLTFFDVYGKVAKTLLDLIKEKGDQAGEQVILELPFSRQELANMAGTSRESLTRILYEFQVRGCLKLEGRKITILNEAILRREVY